MCFCHMGGYTGLKKTALLIYSGPKGKTIYMFMFIYQ